MTEQQAVVMSYNDTAWLMLLLFMCTIPLILWLPRGDANRKQNVMQLVSRIQRMLTGASLHRLRGRLRNRPARPLQWPWRRLELNCATRVLHVSPRNFTGQPATSL